MHNFLHSPVPCARVRINDLAGELGVKSKDILVLLAKMGIEGKTHSSSMSETEAGLVRRRIKSPDLEFVRVTAPRLSEGLRWRGKLDLIIQSICTVVDEMEGGLRMADDPLERRIMRLRAADVMPSDTAKHMADIVRLRFQTGDEFDRAFERLERSIEHEELIDGTRRSVLTYLAQAEAQGTVVVVTASHRSCYLDHRRPVPFQSLMWLLTFRLLQAVGVEEEDRYSRMPRPPFLSDRVQYALTQKGRCENALAADAAELLCAACRSSGGNDQEYEAVRLQVRLKEMLRHKRLIQG